MTVFNDEAEAARLRHLFEHHRLEANAARERREPTAIPREATPDQLLQLAKSNAIVHTMLTAWRAGTLPLENMLIVCVKVLVEQSEGLQKRLTETAMMLPPQPIVLDGVKLVPKP